MRTKSSKHSGQAPNACRLHQLHPAGTDRGSGWATRQGYVCGVSVAYRAEADIRALYIPIRHPDTDNFDAAKVYGWLKDH